jgi:hypothetical protein
MNAGFGQGGLNFEQPANRAIFNEQVIFINIYLHWKVKISRNAEDGGFFINPKIGLTTFLG